MSGYTRRRPGLGLGLTGASRDMMGPPMSPDDLSPQEPMPAAPLANAKKARVQGVDLTPEEQDAYWQKAIGKGVQEFIEKLEF